MPKLKTIAKDEDNFRVRSRLAEDLGKLACSIDDEMLHYGHLFTNKERRRIEAAKNYCFAAATRLNTNQCIIRQIQDTGLGAECD